MNVAFQPARPLLADAVDAAARAILARRLDYETALSAAVSTLARLEPDPDRRLA